MFHSGYSVHYIKKMTILVFVGLDFVGGKKYYRQSEWNVGRKEKYILCRKDGATHLYLTR